MIRRKLLVGAGASLVSGRAAAFGQQGAFHARILETAGSELLTQPRASAPSRWAWELVRRTSAPGRLLTSTVAADAAELVEEPFAVWAGSKAVRPLMRTEVAGLRSFFQLGGVLFVDDASPDVGEFGQSVQAQLERVLPQVPLAPLPKTHVIYKSYYLVDRPVGRVLGPPELKAMIRGQRVQVIFSSHDLLGALARRQSENWSLPMAVSANGARQKAIRLAVNIAMYVLCSDYKDDQVHAEELMRRRGRLRRAR